MGAMPESLPSTRQVPTPGLPSWWAVAADRLGSPFPCDRRPREKEDQRQAVTLGELQHPVGFDVVLVPWVPAKTE